MFELGELRTAALRFLAANRSGTDWNFRFSPSSQPNLIGSSLAAMLGGLLGWTDDLVATDRQHWAERIRGCQRDDGWFEDGDIAAANLRPGYGHDRALLHRTRHALMALRALRGAPVRPFRIVDTWLGKGAMTAWCATLNLADYWYSSNMMMDAAQLLLESAARWQQPGALAAVHELLDFCDAAINPATGFHDRGRSERRNAMAGAMHLYPVYAVMKRPILCPEAALRTTLGLQQADGMFAYTSGTGGEDCLDYDAAMILANLGRQQPDFREPITAAFHRLREGLQSCRNPDGGCGAHRRPETYYFGTTTTPVLPGESSLWATYSRLLTFMMIDGFIKGREPTGFRTGHNLMEIWDGGSGLCSGRPFDL